VATLAPVGQSRAVIVTLAFVNTLAAIGCSGSGIPEERFCAEHAKIECRTLAGWCGFTADACQTARTSACTMRVQANRTGGRPYDQQAAVACIDKLSRAYQTQPIAVTTLREMQAACDRVYHGNNGVDQGCRADADCQQGLVCRGRCVREVQVAAGEACDQTGSRCPGTHYCAITAGGPAGSRRTCIPAIALGQSCAAGSCQEQLRCLDMVCASRLPLEAACDRDLDCAPPAAYCNPYTGLCADRLSFSPGSFACQAQAGPPVLADAGAPDRRVSEAGASPEAADAPADPDADAVPEAGIDSSSD
jgi:hypothetical protein